MQQLRNEPFPPIYFIPPSYPPDHSQICPPQNLQQMRPQLSDNSGYPHHQHAVYHPIYSHLHHINSYWLPHSYPTRQTIPQQHHLLSPQSPQQHHLISEVSPQHHQHQHQKCPSDEGDNVRPASQPEACISHIQDKKSPKKRRGRPSGSKNKQLVMSQHTGPPASSAEQQLLMAQQPISEAMQLQQISKQEENISVVTLSSPEAEEEGQEMYQLEELTTGLKEALEDAKSQIGISEILLKYEQLFFNLQASMPDETELIRTALDNAFRAVLGQTCSGGSLDDVVIIEDDLITPGAAGM